jgi:RNA polymerase sigma factor (sigma-70 family)
MQAALSLPLMQKHNIDLGSFSELVMAHQGQVFAVVYGVLGDRALAEEIAQETFLVGWSKLSAHARVEQRAAWLCGIARNLARNARRRRFRERAPLEVVSEAPSSALERLEEQERELRVRAALESLPERYREPLVLFYVEGESVERVANALAISEELVRQRLRRGREQVRGALDEVQSSLRRSRPGAGFAGLVLAAWTARGAIASAAKPAGVSALAVGAMVTASMVAVALIVPRWLAHGAALARPALAVAPAPSAPPVAIPVPAVAMPAPPIAPSLASPKHAVLPATPRTSTPAPMAGPPVHWQMRVSKQSEPKEPLPEGLQRHIDIDIAEMDVTKALRVIADAAGMSVLIADGLAAEVNVRSHDRPLAEALDEVVAQAGASWRFARVESSGKSEIKIVVSPDAPQEE